MRRWIVGIILLILLIMIMIIGMAMGMGREVMEEEVVVVVG